MSIKRYGTVQKGAGGKSLPFARAVEADGWLYVSGQVAMDNGEIIDGNIVAQTHKTIENVILCGLCGLLNGHLGSRHAGVDPSI